MDNQDQMSGVAVAVMVAIMIPIYIVMIWAFVRIIQKAGYSGWNVLWYFVPIVNIVVFLIFAFGEWPVSKRIRELEQQVFGPSSSGAVDRPA
jgi:drug/metabolite transporter (DMT)-like permease